MERHEIENRRALLRTMLLDLSKSQMILKSSKEKSLIYSNLERIYYINENEKFRHYYSDIYSIITMIDKDEALGNVEILSQNLEIIKSGYHSLNRDDNSNLIDITDEISKLYDHANLDISRLSTMKEIKDKTNQELMNIDILLTDVKNKYSQIENSVQDINRMQKDYITILGIFASIVIAFVSGIAFSTSILQNIANASIYRLVLVAIGISFVLINLIYILVRFIEEINKKNNEKISYPKYMILFNVTCVMGVIIIGCAWFFGLKPLKEMLR